MSLVMDFYMACLDYGPIYLTGFKLAFNLVSPATIHQRDFHELITQTSSRNAS